jgi:hypothetical protein
MQAAAVRRIKAAHLNASASQSTRGNPCVSAALGTVPMQDAHLHGGCQVACGSRRRQIPKTRLAWHRDLGEPERKVGFEFAKPELGQRIAGVGVVDQAHGMPAPRLLAGEIADMSEKAADWRSEAMQDPQGGHASLARVSGIARVSVDTQKKRSWTNSVSPGFTT